MIRRDLENGVCLFTQQVHAFLCGQLAQFWKESLPHELILAAYIHDAGWQERDALPQINAKNQPRTFTELDLDDHFTVWQRSIDHVSGANCYAGLMVSLHATNLYERRLKGGTDTLENVKRIRDFIARQKIVQANLQTELKYNGLVENNLLEQNLSRLQAWDWMSLALCMGQPRPPHQIKAGEFMLTLEITQAGILRVDPWPFVVQDMLLHIEGRHLEQSTFEDDIHLQQMYDSTPLQPYRVRVLPKAQAT